MDLSLENGQINSSGAASPRKISSSNPALKPEMYVRDYKVKMVHIFLYDRLNDTFKGIFTRKRRPHVFDIQLLKKALFNFSFSIATNET